MKVYVPTLIESVEQAEKLPAGTVFRHRDHQPIESWDCNAVPVYGPYEASLTADDLIGWTALVPVEAEEETQDGHGITILHGSTYWQPARTRLVTPWTEVTSP